MDVVKTKDMWYLRFLRNPEKFRQGLSGGVTGGVSPSAFQVNSAKPGSSSFASLRSAVFLVFFFPLVLFAAQHASGVEKSADRGSAGELRDEVVTRMSGRDDGNQPPSRATRKQLITHAFSDGEGGLVRLDTTSANVFLIFSADEFGDGAEKILDILGNEGVKGSFFLTGNFYRNPQFRAIVARMKREGHYLGPHSDDHLLYNSWEKRDSLLVSRRQFRRDLRNNLREIQKAGIPRREVQWFLPPYEWYNRQIGAWSHQMGITVVNFTPGTGTNADYTTPDMKSYRSSEELYTRLMEFEASHPLGLRGALLLIHLGTHPDRTDKFYDHLGKLIAELREKGYVMLRLP